MKHKVLLTGLDRAVFNTFFNKMGDIFECMSASLCYEDLLVHVKYFQPKFVVICLDNESRNDILVYQNLRKRMNSDEVVFVAIGLKNKCEELDNIDSGLVDHFIYMPADDNNIKDSMVSFVMKAQTVMVENEIEKLDNLFVLTEEEKEDGGDFDAGELDALLDMAKLINNAGKPDETPKLFTDANPNDRIRVTKEQALRSDKTATKDSNDRLVVKANDRNDVPIKKQRSENTRILVVDDDKTMLRMIKRKLEEDYEVATAISAKIASNYLEKHEVDLVLLDYEMPDENGPSFLKRIREDESIKDLPVVFLTGVDDMIKVQNVIDLKPQGYLLKPLDANKLMATIQSLVG